MSAGRFLGGAAMLAAAYLLYTKRAEPQVLYQPVAQPAPQPQRNYAPLISWGLDTAMNAFGKSSRSGGRWTELKPGGNGLQGILASLTSKSGASAGDARASGRADVNGLLQLIGGIEAPQGYDQVYGGSRIQPPRPITTMTVDEVIDWQNRSVRSGSASSAAGRYQIIRGTLGELKKGGHVRGSDTFDAATQDRLARVLMEKRGLSKYQSGGMSAETFANNLAKEWASLPVVNGKKRGSSYYGGDGLNKALTTPERVLSRLGVSV